VQYLEFGIPNLVIYARDGESNAEQTHDMEVGNKNLENVAQLKYLGKTEQNLIQEKIEED
jgi:hypothetical protein